MNLDIKGFVEEHYQISVTGVEPMEGYGSENYRVCADSDTYVLKIYTPDQERYLKELLEAEDEILERLATIGSVSFPLPQKTLAGKTLSFSDTEEKYFRLLSFVEGDLLVNSEHTPDLFYSLGKATAEMDRKLMGFKSIASEARRSIWDLQFLALNLENIGLIEDPAEKKIVEYFFLQNAENVKPKFGQLRKSVIHGDVNDWNVSVVDGKVVGIFDFGDITYSPLINELAIAAAYAVMDKEDPVKWVLPLVKGYHGKLPLEEVEIALLYYLIATRLCISVCNFEKARRTTTPSEYVGVSEKSAWNLLKKWIRINPVKFENSLRKEVGLPEKNGDTSAADLKRRKRHTSGALSLQFSKPIKMVGAAFQYMYDSTGDTFLDCYNNIPQVGHCHPRVVDAGQRAMARLNTNTRYLNDDYNSYASDLLSRFPEKLKKVFFVNSGSAASDLAIRLALAHSRNEAIAVMEHGYHGNTRLGIEISHYKYNRKGGSGKHDSVVELQIPDTYKGKYQKNDGTAGKEYAADAIIQVQESGAQVAAFIAEPIIGCGGQVPIAAGYLDEVYSFIRNQGGVTISDEVQTGFGRLGKYFWGFEMHGVVPDIVVLGKPMGNGHPFAAVVTTDEIAESFETGMEFFSSFGGNPVSCLIGQSVLEVLDEESLPENAREVGEYLLGLLEKLVARYEVCGDARGEGLFLGLELVSDKTTKSPNRELAELLQNELREKRILVGTDGPDVNVIKIKPPICFTKDNADELSEAIDEVLRKYE